MGHIQFGIAGSALVFGDVEHLMVAAPFPPKYNWMGVVAFIVFVAEIMAEHS